VVQSNYVRLWHSRDLREAPNRCLLRRNTVEKLLFHSSLQNFRAVQEQLRFLAGSSQIPAPAVWNSLIERSDQSCLNSPEFAFLAENSELSIFELFNGIPPKHALAAKATLGDRR
jgi:hypothetical protein